PPSLLVPVFPHVFPFHVLLPATAAPDLSTLSLHDALPISSSSTVAPPTFTFSSLNPSRAARCAAFLASSLVPVTTVMSVWRSTSDRKSTRLNSSHVKISYAVFCLKKKNMKLSDLASMQP